MTGDEVDVYILVYMPIYLVHWQSELDENAAPRESLLTACVSPITAYQSKPYCFRHSVNNTRLL